LMQAHAPYLHMATDYMLQQEEIQKKKQTSETNIRRRSATSTAMQGTSGQSTQQRESAYVSNANLKAPLSYESWSHPVIQKQTARQLE